MASEFDTLRQAIDHLAKVAAGGLVGITLDRPAFARLLMDRQQVPKSEIGAMYRTLANGAPFQLVTPFGLVLIKKSGE